MGNHPHATYTAEVAAECATRMQMKCMAELDDSVNHRGQNMHLAKRFRRTCLQFLLDGIDRLEESLTRGTNKEPNKRDFRSKFDSILRLYAILRVS